MNLNSLKVLIVDDEPSITYHLKRNLEKHCKELITFNNPNEAFEYINSNYENIDILISDIRMPNINGIELCKSAKLLKKNIITILLSASNDVNFLMDAINEDIDKFIPKPYRVNKLILVLEEFAKNIINEQNARKFKENEELRIMQESIIYMLGNVVENRSKETSQHLKRVALYSEVLAKRLNLSKHQISLLKTSSMLHDLGKIAIDDTILNKPGSLTDEEFKKVKTHTTIGYDILKTSNTKILKMAATIAYEHHENWDGTGYPLGIKENEISIEGRIVSICDVFDALTYDRCYKKAWSLEEAIKFISDQKGKKFDPSLVNLFLGSINEIIYIHKKYNEE